MLLFMAQTAHRCPSLPSLPALPKACSSPAPCPPPRPRTHFLLFRSKPPEAGRGVWGGGRGRGRPVRTRACCQGDGPGRGAGASCRPHAGGQGPVAGPQLPHKGAQPERGGNGTKRFLGCPWQRSDINFGLGGSQRGPPFPHTRRGTSGTRQQSTFEMQLRLRTHGLSPPEAPRLARKKGARRKAPAIDAGPGARRGGARAAGPGTGSARILADASREPDLA